MLGIELSEKEIKKKKTKRNFKKSKKDSCSRMFLYLSSKWPTIPKSNELG